MDLRKNSQEERGQKELLCYESQFYYSAMQMKHIWFTSDTALCPLVEDLYCLRGLDTPAYILEPQASIGNKKIILIGYKSGIDLGYSFL